MTPAKTTPRTNSKPGPKRKFTVTRKKSPLSADKKDAVRVIPLGGLEEVGRNMVVIEIGEDIFISDVGFQFVGEADAPGVDYILPNTTYLEARKKRIKAVFITHAHLDHIGGIPFVMERIGNPPIYTRALSGLMIKKRQEEFPHKPTPDIKTVEPGDKLKIGNTDVEFFKVTHSIPDAMGLKLKTKYGNIVISGDLKLDRESKDGEPTKEEKKVWGDIGKEKNILFLADSTNAWKEGFSITEREVHKNLEDIIRDIKGRVIIGAFASQLERLIKMVEVAQELGRTVVIDGRSLVTNIKVAEAAGMLKVKKGAVVDIKQVNDFPPEKVIVLATGGQGEQYAALTRASRGEHRHLKFTDKDTIILSSSIIPGNEKAIQSLKDGLYKHDLHIITYQTSDVHSTGHGNIGELLWFVNQVKPKFLMPGYGYPFMKYNFSHAARDQGFPKEDIIIADNGHIIELTGEDSFKILKDKASAEPMMVDGHNISTMLGSPILKDREMLGADGIFVIIAVLDHKTGRVRKSPDIISRGFIYLKESQELLKQARILAKKTIEEVSKGKRTDLDKLRNEVKDKINRLLRQKTGKRPVVLPVMIEV